MRDLLLDAIWSCARTAPDAVADPEREALDRLEWHATQVPGTAADAMRSSGASDFVERDYDAEDWWFRCRFRGERGNWNLQFDGLATLADVWLNGVHLTRSENMFLRSSVDVDGLEDENELVIRCASLASARGAGRPRPRWKTAQVEYQGLRSIRSTLLGRIPGWARTPRVVGPWRPIRLTEVDALADADVQLSTRCVGVGGRIEAVVTLRRGETLPDSPELSCQEHAIPFDVGEEGNLVVMRATLALDQVERWWPHTHGPQPLYPVQIRAGGHDTPIGRVGFKTVEVDQSDGGFRFVINGTDLFIRGANWFPADPVLFSTDDAQLKARLDLMREANLNMVRIPGTTAYAERALLDACDELGILVWHDCMFGYMDYPDDPSFLAMAGAEVRQALTDLSSHASLAVVCGNQEVEEIAAMSGVSGSDFESELFDKLIPSLAAELTPEAIFVTSNPTGGDPSYRPDTGVSQYFGIGGYLRTFDQLRSDSVRFAAECLCFATPPEPDAIDRFGGAYLAVHDPRWKSSLHHDAGRSWDMDDLRAYYTGVVFGVDPFRERYVDAERSLDLGRATNAMLVETVFSEWRCNQPTCGGGLVLGLNDVAAGAGWGLIDVDGNPKAPWFALRRASLSPCVRFRDEGLNGLYTHVFNEEDAPLEGALVIELYSAGQTLAEQATHEIVVEPHTSLAVNASQLFTGFYDINYAYRFGPPSYDVVVARLVVGDTTVSEDVFLPLGHGRAREGDVGLRATWTATERGPILRVSTQRFAQWVSVNVTGFRPSDSWFHLPPKSERLITLLDGDDARPPRGRVRSINSFTDATIRPAEDQ